MGQSCCLASENKKPSQKLNFPNRIYSEFEKFVEEEVIDCEALLAKENVLFLSHQFIQEHKVLSLLAASFRPIKSEKTMYAISICLMVSTKRINCKTIIDPFVIKHLVKSISLSSQEDALWGLIALYKLCSLRQIMLQIKNFVSISEIVELIKTQKWMRRELGTFLFALYWPDIEQNIVISIKEYSSEFDDQVKALLRYML